VHKVGLDIRRILGNMQNFFVDVMDRKIVLIWTGLVKIFSSFPGIYACFFLLITCRDPGYFPVDELIF
jgi:hypothetical protein